MNKSMGPRELCLDLLPRSTCNVQVAAVVTDACGKIISWGWNHSGPDGMGLCAEAHAIRRANKDRTQFGIVFTAAIRNRGGKKGKVLKAKPCAKCQKLLHKHSMIYNYRDTNGEWKCD